MKHFACRKFNLLAIDGRCSKYTYRAHVFLMRSLSAFLSQSLVTVCSLGSSRVVRLIPRTRVAQAQHESWNLVSCPKVFTSPRAASCVTSLMSGTPSSGACTPSLTVIRPTSTSSFSYDPLPGEIQPCAELPIYVNLSEKLDLQTLITESMSRGNGEEESLWWRYRDRTAYTSYKDGFTD